MAAIRIESNNSWWDLNTDLMAYHRSPKMGSGARTEFYFDRAVVAPEGGFAILCKDSSGNAEGYCRTLTVDDEPVLKPSYVCVPGDDGAPFVIITPQEG